MSCSAWGTPGASCVLGQRGPEYQVDPGAVLFSQALDACGHRLLWKCPQGPPRLLHTLLFGQVPSFLFLIFINAPRSPPL